jgi:hypothetical protein
MSSRTLFEPSMWKEHFPIFASHLIVAAMMGCFLITVVQVGSRVAPGWDGDFLIIAGLGASLEAMIARRRLKSYAALSPEWLAAHAAEWVVLLVFIKLVYYAVNGFDRLLTDLALWQQNFLSNFLTGEYLAAVTVIFLVWLWSVSLSNALVELIDEEQEPRLDRETGHPVMRASIRRRLADQVLWVGILMIFITSMLQLDWLSGWLPGPPHRGGYYNLLAYFLLALILLALTQFSTLRISWIREDIPFRREVTYRWALYSFLLILGLALLASLLPTRYSIGLLTVLNYLVGFFMWAVRILFNLLALPFFLIWMLLSRLMSRENGQEEEPLMPELPFRSEVTDAAGAPIPWLELLKSLAFWVVFAGVILIAVRYYLQEHPELAVRLSQVTPLRWLSTAWQWLRAWGRGVNRQVGAALGERLRRLRSRAMQASGQGAWGYVNPRRLTPRQRVMFFYLAMVRRGGESGLPRQASQTPYEYSNRLQANLPSQGDGVDIQQDILSLTERFVEAKYSRHEVTDEQASLARRTWERLRRALSRRASQGTERVPPQETAQDED